jgi:hypothetical protein
MPLWRHWQLAFQGIPTDIAWLHLEPSGEISTIALVAVLIAAGILSFLLIIQKQTPRPAYTLALFGLILAMLPLTLWAARSDQRYYPNNENYQAAVGTVCATAARDDIVLVDAYLKPLWWYSFNFGCGKLEWLGLPYEHVKPYSGDLFYPRLSELEVLLREKQAQGREIYLLEAVPPDPLAYHKELEKYGFGSVLLREFEQRDEGVGLYKLEF